MKIEYVNNYLSIKNFSPVTLKDFSIITGLNGSGKTHFLKGLSQGSFKINDFSHQEIVYYDYNDFIVKRVAISNSANSVIDKYSNLVIDKNNRLKEIILDLVMNLPNKIDKALYLFYSLGCYDKETLFNNESDIELLKIIKKEHSIDFETALLNQRNGFSNEFKDLINHVNSKSRLTEILEIDHDYLFKKYQDFLRDVSARIRESKEFPNYLADKISKQGIKNAITSDDYESPTFILDELINSEKIYHLKSKTNKFNLYLNETQDENNSCLNKEEFIELNGEYPTKKINQVLNEFDCNGYFLETRYTNDRFGIAKKDIGVNIVLKSKKNDFVVTFDSLSSGEKTLIALSLLIHKARKNKILPKVLLLDEIDSSLHPSMIKRLISVIETIFVKEQGLKVIIATHSPTTIALAPYEAIYQIDKNNLKKIASPLDKDRAIRILTEGFASLSKNESKLSIQYNVSQTNLPVLFTEGITDKIILENAWKKLYDDAKMPFYIQDCFCADVLYTLLKRGDDGKDGIFTQYGDKKFLGLFDFDGKGYESWNGIKWSNHIEKDPYKCLSKTNDNNGYILLLPVPKNEIKHQVLNEEGNHFGNKSILPIELLFFGVECLKKYYKKNSIVGGGSEIKFSWKKRSLAEKTANLNKEDFINFIPLFDKIKEIIKY